MANWKRYFSIWILHRNIQLCKVSELCKTARWISRRYHSDTRNHNYNIRRM